MNFLISDTLTDMLGLQIQPSPDVFTHPGAQRRFRTVSTPEEFQAALEAPWDKWTVFLHAEPAADLDERMA